MAAFEASWGRVVLGVLTVLFLPPLMLVFVQESLAGRRAQRDLAFVARRDGRRDRRSLEGRAADCFQRIRPLPFAHRNDDGTEHEHSRIVLGVTATLQDYLERESTGEIVEGGGKWKDVETVWTFTFTRGEWKVSNIEDDSTSLAHALHRKHLPAIESTMPGRLDA